MFSGFSSNRLYIYVYFATGIPEAYVYFRENVRILVGTFPLFREV